MTDNSRLYTVYICLGSNIGDKLQHCRNGIDALVHSGKNIFRRQSPFYYSEPIDFEDQDWFVNVVIEMDTVLNPLSLMKELKSVEQHEGRTEQSIRFGPRVLDMDILLYDK